MKGCDRQYRSSSRECTEECTDANSCKEQTDRDNERAKNKLVEKASELGIGFAHIEDTLVVPTARYDDSTWTKLFKFRLLPLHHDDIKREAAVAVDDLDEFKKKRSAVEILLNVQRLVPVLVRPEQLTSKIDEQRLILTGIP